MGESSYIYLVRAKDDIEILDDGESYENFHPTFTYPVRSFLPFISE